LSDGRKTTHEVIDLWKRMNAWVYEGFDKTYETMGVSFDKIYYESETYLLGKQKVLEAVDKNLLLREEDQSVWIDLTEEGLDRKILLRSDGTSVYITQDIGTAILRHDDFNPSKMLYVVGNEQEYHFKVLELIMRKLEYQWADKIQHISYGMVELPHGKMKSREGTVVDADNLMQEMFDTAEQMSAELGKLDGFPPEEREKIIRSIGLGALKYFILKVDPRKNMLFNPAESVDFNGNTGPFIQYTYARIQSVMRKATEAGINLHAGLNQSLIPDMKETDVLKLLYEFPGIVKEAGNMLSPALIANYLYELAKEYNQFYHDFPVIKEQDALKRDFRLKLSLAVSNVIKTGMELLGIDVPDRM
jgi:arginyl-tRNA synthetase